MKEGDTYTNPQGYQLKIESLDFEMNKVHCIETRNGQFVAAPRLTFIGFRMYLSRMGYQKNG